MNLQGATLAANDATPTRIESKDVLIEYLAAGCKSPEQFRIGTEHEKFCFALDDHSPVGYGGKRGIGALLQGLADEFAWEPVFEEGKIIALARDGASITLEPGGQFELSGAPLENVHETCNEVHTHLAQVKAVGDRLGIGFLGMGFHPSAKLEDIDWMPKARYVIMRNYMPKVGKRGHDMMKRTCTVQVNLDFESEADMVRKLRIGVALQPVATALFANSPFAEGKPNGFLSYRAHAWTDTDADRTGNLPFVFDDSMGFERYVDYVLDVPMYFVRREGRYLDAAGHSFRDFMRGELAVLPGEHATMADWEDHLTTLFPEVRLKRYIEMRGADGGPWGRLCALPALWVGLLYDDAAMAATESLFADWNAEQRTTLMLDATRLGLAAKINGRSLGEIARQTLQIAADGLSRRARTDSKGQDERKFLAPLEAIVERNQTPAEIKLALYHGAWNQQIDPLFERYAY